MSDYDVAVVGYGPTGMTLAALLGQLGRLVVVLERYSGLYNLPRAACFDDEIMRTFQKLGLVDEISRGAEIQPGYEWINGSGQILVDFQYDNPAPAGWAALYMMFQPHIEAVLDRHDKSLPTVDIRQGVTVSEIEQNGDAVILRGVSANGEPVSVRARYAVGADGGNGFTRRTFGQHIDDYGFQENWLVCDFRLRGTVLPPRFRQVCDPVQPIAIVNIGPGYHRFSFNAQCRRDGRTSNQARRSLVARQRIPDQERCRDYPCCQLHLPLANRRAVAAWACVPGWRRGA